MSNISIQGLDKAEVLCALYNNAKPQGMSFLHSTPEYMGVEEAREFLKYPHLSFDYLKGRVMKVDLSKDSFDPWLYDRGNGEGKAKRIIDNLREQKTDA